MDANFHFILNKGHWHWQVADDSGVPIVKSTVPLARLADQMALIDAVLEVLTQARTTIVDA